MYEDFEDKKSTFNSKYYHPHPYLQVIRTVPVVGGHQQPLYLRQETLAAFVAGEQHRLV